MATKKAKKKTSNPKHCTCGADDEPLYKVNGKTVEEITLTVVWDHGHFGSDAPYPYSCVDALARYISGAQLHDESGDYHGEVSAVLGTNSVPLLLRKVENTHQGNLGLIED
tara:strand:+ start:9749 stop:10081 length:333 start_codon:yes stop_codon:yes gene_type:complete